MPRIRDSASNPYDFCLLHMPSESFADKEFGDRGDGPNGRGNCYVYEDEHPSYANEDYRCHECGAELTSDDD